MTYSRLTGGDEEWGVIEKPRGAEEGLAHSQVCILPAVHLEEERNHSRMQGYTNCWTSPQPLSKNFFIRLKSDHCLALSVSHSITPRLLWDLMWPWRVKFHATSPCLTSCCHWNKTKAILLMLDEKRFFVHVGTKLGVKKWLDQFSCHFRPF